MGHRPTPTRRPAALVGDLPAQRGPTPTRRGHAHRPPLDRPRMDPRLADGLNDAGNADSAPTDNAPTGSPPAGGATVRVRGLRRTGQVRSISNTCSSAEDPTRQFSGASPRSRPSRSRSSSRRERRSGAARLGLGRSRIVRGWRRIGVGGPAPAPSAPVPPEPSAALASMSSPIPRAQGCATS